MKLHLSVFLLAVSLLSACACKQDAKTDAAKAGFVGESIGNPDWALHLGKKEAPEGDVFASKFLDGPSVCYVFTMRKASGEWQLTSSCK